MNSWKSRMLHHRQLVAGTSEFTFAKPAEFEFIAGQYVIVKLPELHYPDERGPARSFTLLSAPLEPELRIATRMTGSGFKQTLTEMRTEPIELYGPQGEFALRTPSNGKAIWIAGGIGITPFYSMLHDSMHQELLPQTTLIYSNRDFEHAAFHLEFTELAKHSSQWRYLPTFTDLSDDDSWPGERRLINAEFLQEIKADLVDADIYLCGPPAMVEAIKSDLSRLGISERRIFFESFLGY